MTAIRNWLLGIIVTCGILTVCYGVTPKGKYRNILCRTGGIILLLAVMKPIIQTDWPELLGSFEDWREEIGLESEAYQEIQGEELMTLIAEKTAAYIEEKAMAMGVVCHARVDCVEREGVPFPDRIVLDIPYSAEISKQISRDLDIPEEKQTWQEAAE